MTAIREPASAPWQPAVKVVGMHWNDNRSSDVQMTFLSPSNIEVRKAARAYHLRKGAQACLGTLLVRQAETSLASEAFLVPGGPGDLSHLNGQHPQPLLNLLGCASSSGNVAHNVAPRTLCPLRRWLLLVQSFFTVLVPIDSSNQGLACICNGSTPGGGGGKGCACIGMCALSGGGMGGGGPVGGLGPGMLRNGGCVPVTSRQS